MTKVFVLIKCLLVAYITVWINPCAIANDVLEVRHPVNSDNSVYRQRDKYFLAQLSLALKMAEQSYQLIPSPVPTMPEDRSIMLINNGYYNVHWLNTSENREDELLAIKIPLAKGLIGWRLMLIHASNAQRFSSVKDVSELKKLVAGVGHDWPDMAVFQHNNFSVFSASSTAGLQRMLNLKRIDYFPRSILEIWQEHATTEHPQLIIDESMVLQYPAAMYFFVAKDNVALHDAIKYGLEKAIETGEFDALFYQYFGDVITKAKLDQRRLFKVSNPIINDQEYLSKEALWFSPEKMRNEQ
ncbi:MAG: transporter substrate-binding domain-containing protein [Alteromonadaceae bacterium]|nr:transporter substrate-binding domain-containing protein [Alteromonadaceae bacterium]